MPTCPYCNKECKARGLKNHVRLAGDEHGPKGDLPDDFDEAVDEQEHLPDVNEDGDDDDEPPAPGTAAREPQGEATVVSPDELLGDVNTEPPEADDADGYTYTFGTLTIRNVSESDPNVEVCDGGETATVGDEKGNAHKATASAGDLFVKTDDGNFLCEPRDGGDIYMVLN